MPPMPPRIRAADADRDRVVAALGAHYAAGRLSAGEFDDRVTAAMAARTLDDLDRLLADLPHVDLREYELPDARLRRPPASGGLPATGVPGRRRDDGAA
jgi:hypothetical protein